MGIVDRDALRAAIRGAAAAAWGIAVALAAAGAAALLFTDDPETETLVGMVAWLGAFAILLWKLPK